MENRMSRRQLGLAALAVSPFAQSQQKYTGALEGLEGKVNLLDFDTVAYSRERYRSAPLRLTFRADTRKQAEAWQKKLRAKLTELLGGFPSARTPLDPRTLEVREFPKYRLEKFVIRTRPGAAVLGYLLTPAATQPPHTAMICLPGHGRGVDDIVGIDSEGKDRTNKSGYQHDFAIQAVEHGMAAVAIEQMAFGCRRDPAARKKGLGASSCQPAAGAALLLGETMIGWRVWDVMRVCDWIATRKELDASRIGCMGISGGGTITTFAAALEPRIQLAFVSGYLNLFRDCIFSLSHCIDNYVPGILNWCEMYDVAGLIAPRPLFVESGDRDDIFPIEASRESFARAKKVYELFGAAGNAEQEVFSGEHSFHGVGGLPFAARRLKA